MLSDEIRTRLGQLHRTHSSGLPQRPQTVTATSQFIAAPAIGINPLESADEVENASGKHLRFRVPLNSMWPAAGQTIAARPSQSFALVPTAAVHEELVAVAQYF